MNTTPRQFKILRRPRKGAILPLLVMLTLLMSMTSLALIHLAQQARLRSVRFTAATAARIAADAGIERTIYLVNKQIEAGQWNGTIPALQSEPLLGSNTTYTVQLTGDAQSGYEIVSNGLSGYQSKSVRVPVTIETGGGGASFAIMTQLRAIIQNQAAVRGFNSADPSETNVPAAVATLSTLSNSIYLRNNSFIYGDAYVGPGGDPSRVVNSRTAVKGNIYVLEEGTTMPVVEAPNLNFRGQLTGYNIVLNSSDSGRYGDINIGPGGTLQINGNVVLYIMGAGVRLANFAQIVVNNGATLKLFLDGDVYLDNHSHIRTASGRPGDLQIYGTKNCRRIHFQTENNVSAVICAPQADLLLNNQGTLRGSFITKSFEMKNGGTVYYDKALLGTPVDFVGSSGGGGVTVIRWGSN
jgi:hypothetical protein